MRTLVTILSLSWLVATSAAEPPNVILILADDMAPGDLSSEHPEEVDRLSKLYRSWFSEIEADRSHN